MASSDAATSLESEYQVFLSFRGPDTRTGFTDVLFHNLIDARICVFRDDEELRVGERIKTSLQQAIDNSRIYIPIFSRTYASSQWCLHELSQIVANTLNSHGNKEILPIFFDVKPDDVKLKTPLYRDAILCLVREKKLSNEEVNAWREALMEVDAIKGWEVKKYKGHGELIKLVVEEVVQKLKTKHRLVTEFLVGIDDRVAAVSELLDVNSSDVRLIKIYGMGGIGKTTLAKVVFNQFSSQFGKYCCFLEDVRVKSSRIDGLVELQKKLLFEIGIHAGTKSIDEIDYGMKRTREALYNKKVLIVLDDIDNNEQVEKLVGKSALRSGSRILITTRNKHVLLINRIEYRILDYEMEVMSTDHALELFSRHAFNRGSPLAKYDDISREIVYAIGRLPLALEVIGSLLYHKTQERWKKTLKDLRKAPHCDIFRKLKISYDALSFEQKQIFLDIACFFIGEDMTNAIYMWEDSEFSTVTGVDILINMSLVKIGKNNKFWMHDQLRDLGREIVRQENPINPGKRTRLWKYEEILDAITTKEMKMTVQALDLDLRKSYLKDVIEGEEIARFEHLRYLKLNWGSFIGNLANCLTELRWIVWSNPPPTFKPTNMHLKNVVILEFLEIDFIDDSELQNIVQVARRLKVFSLERCESITRTPDFSGCSELERLTFEQCHNLRKIDSSIGKLKCLTDLKICNCNCLEDVPDEIGDLVNLKHFIVRWCNVKKLPNSIWKLKSLCKVLFVNTYPNLASANSWELPHAIGMLQNLEVLLLEGPYLKGQLPSQIGSLRFLRALYLSGSRVSEVPKTISMLPRLQILDLMRCDEIQELPSLPTSLTHLQVSFRSLKVVPNLSNLTNLVNLELYDWGGGGKKIYASELWWIGRLSKLVKLSLQLRNVRAPAALVSLPLLKELHLYGLKLQNFPQLPWSLQKLVIDNFNSIGSLSLILRNLSFLVLYKSPIQEFQLDGVQLPNMMDFKVTCCVSLERFRLSSMRTLKELRMSDCKKLLEIQFSELESLEELDIQHCESFQRLVYMGEAGHDCNEFANESISCGRKLILLSRAFNKLESFTLVGCHKVVEIQVVGKSESWKYFILSTSPFVQILGGLSNLKNLKSLCIDHNKGLRVVEGLDDLEFLEELKVFFCRSLERLIDVSSTKLPNHCHIHIHDCGKDFRGFLESYKRHRVLHLRPRL